MEKEQRALYKSVHVCVRKKEEESRGREMRQSQDEMPKEWNRDLVVVREQEAAIIKDFKRAESERG